MDNKAIKTVGTGGGCTADIITLQSGEVIVVSDEYVGAFENEDAFWGDEGIAMFGSYVDGNTTLESLHAYKAELVADIPNGEYARNWQRWDELDMVNEAIAIVEGADHA